LSVRVIMRFRQQLSYLSYVSFVYLVLLSAQCEAGKLVDRTPEPEPEPEPLSKEHDDAVVEVYSEPELAVDPEPEPAHEFENTAKAYDGKGAKVLPILAKLQAKYESMNDKDKSKLLEKADTYRAKFKTAIDKIDDATAQKYGLNRLLINKILGLDQAQELDTGYAEEQVVSQDHGSGFYGSELPAVEETSYPEPEPEPREGRGYEAREENYDHLLEDHNQEPLYADMLNIDDLKDKPVYIPGEDEHYKEFRDSLRFMARTLSEGPRPIYANNHQAPNKVPAYGYEDMLARIPFPAQVPAAPYRMATNEAYDAEYMYDPRDAMAAYHQTYPELYPQYIPGVPEMYQLAPPPVHMTISEAGYHYPVVMPGAGYHYPVEMPEAGYQYPVVMPPSYNRLMAQYDMPRRNTVRPHMILYP
jgi:hypothetical protein